MPALFLLAVIAPAGVSLGGGAPEAQIIREVRFVYRDPATGAEDPVDSPSPQILAGRTRLRPGRQFSQQTANEDLRRFIDEHDMVCLAVRHEPVPGGLRVTFVFERTPRVWAVLIVARKGTPSVPRSRLMEKAVRLRRDHRISLAAIDADRQRILGYLRDSGHHFATVDARYALKETRAGFADVVFEIDRGPKVQPERISFFGNVALSRDQLLELMRTREDTWRTSKRFVQEAYEADIERIRRHYRANGWENVRVMARPVLFDPEFVRIRVDYRQRNGEKIVTGLSIRGANTVQSGPIRRRFLTRPGAVFSRPRLDRDIEWLKARYYSAGFRADPRDVNVRHKDLGRGRGRTMAVVVFAKAQETVTIRITSRRGPAGVPVVDQISHRTTGPFSNQQIAGLAALRPGANLTQGALQSDIRAIARFYTQPGPQHDYALLGVRERPLPGGQGILVEMTFMKKGRAAYLRIDIDEGQQYRVGTISFDGVRPVFEGHIRDRLRLRPGKVFTLGSLAADVRTVRMVFQEQGYADVRVDEQHRTRADRNTYDVTFAVRPGPLFRINLIRPRENTRTRPDVIVREMALKPGDRFDIRKIAESARRLHNLRYFERVKITPVDSKRVGPKGIGYKDLYVEVREANTRRLMIGAGASSAHGVFLDMRFQDINFDISDPPKSWDDFVSGTAYAGAGQTFALYLRVGSETTQLGFHWHEPWLNERPVELGVSAGYFSRDWDEYSVGKLGAEVTLGKRFRQGSVTSFVGLRAHRANISSISRTAPPDVWDDEGPHNVLGLFAGIRHSTVDDRVFPTQGSMRMLMAELIGTPFFEAIKLIAEGRWYYTVHEAADRSRQVVSLWGNIGIIAGGDLPVFERLYAGGLGSVRGFATHGISPLNNRIYINPNNPGLGTIPVATGDPIGGNFRIEGGLEYYFPIIRDRLRGLMFLDVGSVAQNSLGVGTALSDLRVSTGVGVQFAHFGRIPMAMYLGFPLKKERGDERETFTFTIGFYWP